MSSSSTSVARDAFEFTKSYVEQSLSHRSDTQVRTFRELLLGITRRRTIMLHEAPEARGCIGKSEGLFSAFPLNKS
jgi:hypothetical protein